MVNYNKFFEFLNQKENRPFRNVVNTDHIILIQNEPYYVREDRQAEEDTNILTLYAYKFSFSVPIKHSVELKPFTNLKPGDHFYNDNKVEFLRPYIQDKPLSQNDIVILGVKSSNEMKFWVFDGPKFIYLVYDRFYTQKVSPRIESIYGDKIFYRYYGIIKVLGSTKNNTEIPELQ